MTNKSQLKVFIGPHEVAGYYSNLSKGMREIGVDCDFMTFTDHVFDYGGQSKHPKLLKASKFLKHLYVKKRNVLTLLLFATTSVFLSSLWAIFAMFRYDVFIFGFGKSLLLNNLDLFFLKLLKKKVIANLCHGSESRPPYMCGGHQAIMERNKNGFEKLSKLTKAVFRRTRRFESYSEIVIGSAFSTSHFLKGKFVNSLVLGIPIDYDFSKTAFEKSKRERGEETRILHCPSDPLAKGTAKILEAIGNLKKQGHQIRLILLKGRPHAEVIEQLKLCDFVVDQIYSDTLLAGFAAEAAWFGKPAVVGGYGLERLKRLMSKEFCAPSLICHPEDVENAIEQLILNPTKRENIGKDAQKFVTCHCQPGKVAARYLRLIQDDVPKEWWLEAKDCNYYHGAGQSIMKTKQNIRGMVDLFGKKSLQLNHNSNLRKAMLNFAKLEISSS